FGCDYDTTKVYDLSKKSADMNNVLAITKMADYYNRGTYFIKDTKKAVELYEKALSIDNNNIRALNDLSHIYRDAKNTEKYFELTNKLLDMKYIFAITNLLDYYLDNGEFKKRFELCKKIIDD